MVIFGLVISKNFGSLVLLLTVEQVKHGLDYQNPYFLLIILALSVDSRITKY